jgi:hypothetical protein
MSDYTLRPCVDGLKAVGLLNGILELMDRRIGDPKEHQGLAWLQLTVLPTSNIYSTSELGRCYKMVKVICCPSRAL